MWVGLAASLAAWCVLARFYKWYYWCFPMLMLAGLSRACEDRPRRRRWRFAVGLIAGVGFLYRHDLGVACLLAALVVMAAQMAARTLGAGSEHGLSRLRPAAAPSGNRTGMAGGRMPAPGGLLVCRSGSHRWVDQLLVVHFRHVGRHIGHGRALASPAAALGLRNPASSESCRCQLLVVMGLSYGAAILSGTCALLRNRRHRPPDAIPLLAAGILGLAISPQALFRPDTQHILQVIPPLLVVAALLLLRLFDGRGWERQAFGIGAAAVAAALAYLALLTFPFACLRSELRVDLAPLGRNLPQRYRALAAGLDAADPANPVVQAARAVRLRTTSDQSIIVTPLVPQIYFWADRPMSGLLNGYAGIFSQESWRRRNLAAVQQKPPALVVADRDFLRGNPHSLLKKYNPELYDWLKEHYPRVVAECGNFVVCGKGSLDGASAPW